MIAGFRESIWLFDLDGTLVDTGGAGLRALEAATIEVFGGPGPPLDLRGATDSGILEGLFDHFGHRPCGERRRRFFECYLGGLEANLAAGTHGGRRLDGALELLERAAARDGLLLGLLTGNIERGARMKTRHFGIDRFFRFGAYGCDHADRNRLGPVALERARAHAGRAVGGHEVLVIGDTPRDVACARAIGARCLAVATGAFTRPELESCGADRVVDSLEELG